MNKYIYLLWHHDEYGPEGLKATLDRGNVISLAEEYNSNGWFGKDNNPLDRLNGLLLKTDEELSKGSGIHSLMNGWGGLCFQVIKEAK